MNIFLITGRILLFTATVVCLACFLLNPSLGRDAVRTVKAGFRHGLWQCVLILSKKKLPIEFWIWETMDDEEVCTDCWERATRPPMDIADWLKEKVSPEPLKANTNCGERCRCRLTLHKQE